MQRYVVIATYNEAENIEKILRQIAVALPEACVLVIDDNSPDGTAQMVRRCAHDLPQVDVLVRAKREGYGPACLMGLQEAYRRGADEIAYMDADGSHDPFDLTRLFAALQVADVAVGSRYCEGGKITDWGWWRRLVSWAGNELTRSWLRLEIKDFTGGFRAMRAPVVGSLHTDQITARGYAYQLQVLLTMLRAGFRVIEVPIVFRDRQLGKSKFSLTMIVEALGFLLHAHGTATPRSAGESD